MSRSRLAKVKSAANSRPNLSVGQPNDSEGLFSTFIPGDKLDLGLTHAELIGDEFDDSSIGSAFDGGCGDLDAQSISAPPGYLVSGTAGDDVQLKKSFGELRYHLIRRSWALSMLRIGRRA